MRGDGNLGQRSCGGSVAPRGHGASELRPGGRCKRGSRGCESRDRDQELQPGSAAPDAACLVLQGRVAIRRAERGPVGFTELR